ncbi:MAG: acyloxyacyl hydrolase [Flavobacteriaceae bacterium]|nr:acyloxyacyl hydrolase [Flavobacteriaceae bacterium]
MKNTTKQPLRFNRLQVTAAALTWLLCCSTYIFAQTEEKNLWEFEVNAFHGSILKHNENISHLLTDHQQGFILAMSRKTFGEKEWQSLYHFPDVGVSFSYQNMMNTYLGENYAFYGHINWYLFRRKLMFRIGQGLAYTTKAYDRETNFRNNAFGTDIMSGTYFMLQYKQSKIFKNWGMQAGLTLLHYSNANVKAPNNSTNTLAFSLGFLHAPLEKREYKRWAKEKFTEPIRFNFVFRSGVNESDVVGLGRHPFYTFSFYADKRLNKKSALQLGSEVFFSRFLRSLIEFESIAFPEKNVSGDEDWRRVGVFIGHELFVGKWSLETQLGYYVYYDFDFEGRVYNRIGLKYYINNHWFGSLSLKTHAAKAENMAVGIGYRL